MAVELTATDYSGTGTGAAATYATGIYANASDQIKVYVDGALQTIGDDYSLSGIGSAGGVDVLGTFTLGATVYIERVTPITQLVNTQNNETILEDVLDAEFDKLTMIAQEADGKLLRALLVPKGETAAEMPSAATRANKVLAFDGSGNPIPASNHDDAVAAAEASAASALAAKVAAEAARDATLTAYDSFDDRYLGAKAADPAVDNDGNALIGGALYYNTVAQEMRLWTGSAWVAAYVAAGNYVARAGDTMTGPLTLSGAPTANLHAATKLYVDNLVTAAALLAKIVTIDGAGSGLDADTVDGLQGADLVQLTGAQSITGQKTFASPILNTPFFDGAQVPTIAGAAPLFMARAWVNFDGIGAVSIRGSGNVSSVVDNGGTGDFTINLTTPMPDANYAVVTSGITSGGISPDQGAFGIYYNGTVGTAPTTSSFRVWSKDVGGGSLDGSCYNLAVFS